MHNKHIGVDFQQFLKVTILSNCRLLINTSLSRQHAGNTIPYGGCDVGGGGLVCYLARHYSENERYNLFFLIVKSGLIMIVLLRVRFLLGK